MDVSLSELIFESASAALADAGISRQDVDSVVIASGDLVDGRSIANMSSGPAAGAYLRHETRTTNDGIYAVVLACLEILGGRSDTALITGWSKAWELVTPHQAARSRLEPFYMRPLPITDTHVFALEAEWLMSEGRVLREEATETVIKGRAQASQNPRAHLRSRVTEQDILRSELLAWPLRALDLPPATDGAYSLVAVAPGTSHEFPHVLANIRGFAWGSHALTAYDTASFGEPLSVVADKAYRMAGIESVSEVGVIEYVARSSFQDPFVARALLAPLRANVDTDHGSFVPDKLPSLNPSGGWCATYPEQAAGLVATCEVVRQLSNRAGPVQVDQPMIGVAHGQSGFGLQSNAVVVLSRRDSND